MKLPWSALLFALIFVLKLLCPERVVAQVYAEIPNDGLQDASEQLQALINRGVGSIRLKKGVYKLERTVTIDLTKSGATSISGEGVATLKMYGKGPALSFRGSHSGTAAPESFKPTVLEMQRMPMVDGIEIIGAHTQANGIEADGTMQLSISRTTIRECQHGIHLVRLNRNILISDCHIYKNSGIGIFYDHVNLHQSNILGCHISYCTGGGIVSHGGNVRNVHIGTCDIESNMGPQAPPTANVWLDSTGGSIGEVAITGCTIQHSSKAPGCANIRIQGAGQDPSLQRRAGRTTTREGNITIGNNVFSDIQTNIHIQDTRGVTITGNTFWEGFELDLLIERSSNVVVGLNNFDRNPRYLVNGFDNAEKNGIMFRDCDDCILSNNSIAGVWRQAAAVQFSNCNRCNIAGNSILDSDGSGLRLESVRNSLVTGNIIRDDRDQPKKSDSPSIVTKGSNENTITANVLGNGHKDE
ncbi:MAG: right-handed parallel beta-helix repeat-containing protein [Pirellula sp.]